MITKVTTFNLFLPSRVYFFGSSTDDELFQIAEQLYLGTIVAGFLESGINVETNFASNEVYYIDTPLILRALDLQKEEETKPALELLDLIRNTGGTIKA